MCRSPSVVSRPERMAEAERLVVSPGLSLREPTIRAARRRGVDVLGDIELFARAAHAPVVAITGSNGKSTVTALLGEMARAAGQEVRVGGNLGPPALDLLERPAAALFVLELSSFQLETTSSLEPSAAAVLNISEDHQDRYDDLESYAAAKARIFAGEGAMVLNRDDPRVVRMARAGRQLVWFGLGAPRRAEFGVRTQSGQAWIGTDKALLMPTDAVGIAGRHNLANALAALALGTTIGLSRAAMIEGLRDFTGLPHRCQRIPSDDGLHWYNDSKATNVGATVAAIRGLAGSGKLILIAGGEGKGADFTPLASALGDDVRAVVLIGHDAPLIEAAIVGLVPVERARTMLEAAQVARSLAEPGDSVLLSPACASFDMYRNYAARGDDFTAVVQGLSH